MTRPTEIPTQTEGAGSCTSSGVGPLGYRVISGGFGLLTAFIPMALGTGVAPLLDIDPLPAVLIGSFWASFTLIAYPTVAKYGLTKTRPVAAIVGASDHRWRLARGPRARGGRRDR